MIFHDFGGAVRTVVVRASDSHKNVAAANPFGIRLGVIFRDPGSRKPTDDSAGGGTDTCSGQGCGYRSGCDHRTESRNCQRCQPGNEAESAAYSRTGSGACHSAAACSAGGIVALHLAGALAGGDDTDVLARKSLIYKMIHDMLGILHVLEKTGYGFGHLNSPKS
jgi:hypothetical protein